MVRFEEIHRAAHEPHRLDHAGTDEHCDADCSDTREAQHGRHQHVGGHGRDGDPANDRQTGDPRGRSSVMSHVGDHPDRGPPHRPGMTGEGPRGEQTEAGERDGSPVDVTMDDAGPEEHDPHRQRERDAERERHTRIRRGCRTDRPERRPRRRAADIGCDDEQLHESEGSRGDQRAAEDPTEQRVITSAGPHCSAGEEDADDRQDREVRRVPEDPSPDRAGRGRPTCRRGGGIDRHRTHRTGRTHRNGRNGRRDRRAHGDIDSTGDGVTVGAHQAPPDRDRPGLQRRERRDHLGVTSTSVGRTTQLATSAGHVDQRHGHRLERHGLVEHPCDLRRGGRQRRPIDRVARQQCVVSRRDAGMQRQSGTGGGAHGEDQQGEPEAEEAGHGLSGTAAPRRQSNYTT